MISIITLNWNTTDMLIRLFESILKNTKNYFEFVVVDNGSRPEEWKKWQEYMYPDKDNYDDEGVCVVNQGSVIRYKHLPKNLGFSAGNNVGIKMLCGSYDPDMVVFINSDIIINEKDWDEKFTKILINDVAVVGCAYHPLRWDKNANFHIQPIPQQPVESETVQGAFFAVRTDVLEEIKENGMYFDEDRFPMAHYEETDMQIRIMKKGYKVMYVPVNHIHDHHRSSTKSNGYKLSDSIRNEAEFKANSNRNKQNLFNKHKDWFESK